MLVAVGGHTRDIGKTSVVSGLICALPQFPWTAVKITQYGHGVCSENKNAQATITTASTSQAVVVTRNGWGSGGGAPVGRRWRAIRCAGTLPGGTPGETMRSLFSLIAHASPQEEPLRLLRNPPIMRSPARFG